MKNVSLGMALAAACVSVPATALLQSDGAALVAAFKDRVTADAVLLDAARQIQRGAAATAIPALLSHTRANPRNAEAWYLLSMAFGETGQKDLANAAIARATAVKPELNEMTRFMMARAESGGSQAPDADRPARAAPGSSSSAPLRAQAAGAEAPDRALATGPRKAASPARLTGQWKCMRSVVSTSSMYQPMLTFSLSPGSWTDLTFGPARAVKGKASYANGQLKLYSARGALLHTLQWTLAGDGGASDRLVEVLGPNDTSRAGEVCYSASGSARTEAAAKPAAEKRGLLPGHDPFSAFSYPAHVTLSCSCDAVPMESRATFKLTPAAGGAALTYTRTVRQLHTSPAASYKVPLDETATLIVPAAGRYRLSGTVQTPDGRMIPLRIGEELEADVEWSGTYLNGAKYLGVIPAE